jgi:peptide/nickel transport system permease protein
MWLPAAVATLITVLCINFVGDGLRDALDPQQVI